MMSAWSWEGAGSTGHGRVGLLSRLGAALLLWLESCFDGDAGRVRAEEATARLRNVLFREARGTAGRCSGQRTGVTTADRLADGNCQAERRRITRAEGERPARRTVRGATVSDIDGVDLDRGRRRTTGIVE